jgi:hypothetical protein
VATQPGETDGYTLDDHIQAIEAHTQSGEEDLALALPAPGYLFGYVLANNNQTFSIPDNMSHLTPVLPTKPPHQKYRVIGADVVDEQHPWRHDSTKLASQLMGWFKKINQK